MCSSTFGPAIAPSLLTCPTMKTGTSMLLAMPMSTWVHSRICVTLPADEVSAARFIVWIESIITMSGDSRRTVSSTLSMSVVAQI